MNVLLQVLAQVIGFVAYMLYGCFVYVCLSIHSMKRLHHETCIGIPRAIYATLGVPECEQICVADSRQVNGALALSS